MKFYQKLAPTSSTLVFPGGATTKEPPANAGDIKRCEFGP